MSILIRKARETDLPQAAAIYDRILDRQERGLTYVGWLRGVYPTLATAQAAFQADEFFVLEDGGIVMASARINREQVDAYVQMDWAYPAPPDRVMVMHTLTVDPDRGGQGYGRAIVAFYEDYARKNGCICLRIDTNEKNENARRLYAKLGYREAGIVPCVFNGITGVNLVCLEKKL